MPKKYNFIFLITVIFVLVGMALSFLFIRKSRVIQPTEYQKEISQIQTLSTSDETSAIEKDINETNLTNLDKELQEIDKELEGSY